MGCGQEPRINLLCQMHKFCFLPRLHLSVKLSQIDCLARHSLVWIFGRILLFRHRRLAKNIIFFLIEAFGAMNLNCQSKHIQVGCRGTNCI